MRTPLSTHGEGGHGAPGQAQARGRLTRARRAVEQLAPETIEQIARRVAALLRQEPSAEARVPFRAEGGAEAPAGLLTASQLAERLGVSRAWVYEHARRLGAITLGKGPKARLRFDLDTAMQALAKENGAPAPASAAKRARGRPRRPPTAEPPVPLLPINRPGVRGILSAWSRSRHRRGR